MVINCVVPLLTTIFRSLLMPDLLVLTYIHSAPLKKIALASHHGQALCNDELHYTTKRVSLLARPFFFNGNATN